MTPLSLLESGLCVCCPVPKRLQRGSVALASGVSTSGNVFVDTAGNRSRRWMPISNAWSLCRGTLIPDVSCLTCLLRCSGLGVGCPSCSRCFHRVFFISPSSGLSSADGISVPFVSVFFSFWIQQHFVSICTVFVVCFCFPC